MNKKVVIGFFVVIFIIGVSLWLFRQIEESNNNRIINQNPSARPNMANPAAVYCDKQGGKSEIRQGNSGQYGVCVMSDGVECDEWDFFRTHKCSSSSSINCSNVLSAQGIDSCVNKKIIATGTLQMSQDRNKTKGIGNIIFNDNTYLPLLEEASGLEKYNNQKIEILAVLHKCSNVDQCSGIGLTKIDSFSSTDCIDCGIGGWAQMNNSCGGDVTESEQFKKCLSKFKWSGVNQDTDINLIQEGYITIGGSAVSEKPTDYSIKVFIYKQWAVDAFGNLYLLGVLG